MLPLYLMKNDLFNELNENQREAVEFVDGPSVILAGAGSGKTRVLTHKVLNLIVNNGISPSNILMVTFTNKAASEMKNRVKQNLGFIGTFHSLCVRILRRDGEKIGVPADFLIYDENDKADIIGQLLKEQETFKKYTPSFVGSRISGAKDQLIGPDKYLNFFRDYSSELVGTVYNKYQKILEKNQALDFDDLIFKTVELFKSDKKTLEKYQDFFKYILVDEFQDTNFAQYSLTKLLGQKYQNVTVVGDFSQSIYSWRGAEIQNLVKFKNDFKNVAEFSLEQNYRSTQNILNFAFDIISKNQTHPILKLYTDNHEGEEVSINQLETEQYEALFVAEEAQKLAANGAHDLKSIAILYRINAQSRVIEEAFLHMGIPYILVGGTRFYERREVKDILSYVRLIIHPEDEVSLKRILKIGKKRYADFKDLYDELKTDEFKTIEVIDQILQKTKYLDLYRDETEEDLSRLENVKELRSVALNFPNVTDFLTQVALVESEYSEAEKRGGGKEGVYMMTLHQAKGLEFPYVFIVGVEDGILPHSRSLYDMFNLEEERRLFYVGITRAREKLYITHTKKRFFFGRRGPAQISRFLESSDAIYP